MVVFKYSKPMDLAYADMILLANELLLKSVASSSAREHVRGLEQKE
jgi:hypothetical protein